MTGCLYEGAVRHRRFHPTPHEFQYRMFYHYLDLDALPGLLEGGWLWSARRPAPVRFRRQDYLPYRREASLADAVRGLVESETGRRPAGSIRLLTHLRYWGYCFNPVSFYYCFAPGTDRLETIVAEITNTPWGERHSYVLPVGSDGERLRFRFAKQFHVSPFMPMDLAYDWSFSTPGAALAVHMVNLHDGAPLLDATLSLERRPLNREQMLRALVRFPWMTAQVSAAIYWQALRLKIKRSPFYDHPNGEGYGKGRKSSLVD
ncbi:MAG: DUF1365 domain-containing protein [Bryobacteraceae bacterium]